MRSQNIFPIASHSLPAALHMVGIALLYKSRGELPNQRTITLNLAVAEMLFCLLNVINSSVYLAASPVRVTLPYHATTQCLFAFLHCEIRVAMLHIIIDRFLCIWWNIKYPIYMSKRKLRIMIVFQWIGSFVFTVPIMLLTVFNASGQGSAGTASFYFDLVILIVAVLNFLYIFFKVKGIVHENSSQGREQNKTPSVWFKVKVPMFMVITFIIFNVSGSIWYFLDPEVVITGHNFVHTLLRTSGWCSDALIYVLFQKRVRHLLKINCCRKDTENQVAVI